MNVLSGIFQNKCPQCGKGPFWAHANPYINLFKFGGKIYDRCSACGIKYERDPGFWFGAMLISYALNVGQFIILWGFYAMVLPEGRPVWHLILAIIGTSILFFPVVYYLSRPIWIRFFIKFDPDIKAEPNSFPAELTNK
ncbi:MAG: DUF983 domain-containing protein [Flavobacteriales bacterium]|nr:DUF983 domain-containing protein [Flavobacteriales bacterium]MCB9447971.1 DUF983 domain-containing protein [Flavobacteriales bacterium]